MRRTAIALSLAALLGACQTAQDLLEAKKIDYKSQGAQVPTLEIPPDLTTPTRDGRYTVPDTGKSSATLSGFQADRASARGSANSGVLPQVDNMRIERAGSQRWLAIDQPPEKVWPVVRDFWQENGFLVSVSLPEAGVMETDWAENRAKIPQDFLRSMLGKIIEQIYSTAERDKFRTRLERTDEGFTEVFISHRGMVENYVNNAVNRTDERTIWQPRNPDPELEAEFLRRLMVRMGSQAERAKEQVANAAQNPARAAMQEGIGGFQTLEVFEPFDRTWRRVGLALDRVGFTVEDRDRAKGQYFVRYADPEADMKKGEKGFLDKLAFWKTDPKIKTEQYRVHIRQFGGKCVVQVLNKDGGAEATGTTTRIVSLLHEQLK
jgi:outer membrane protein assembly factor BamC